MGFHGTKAQNRKVCGNDSKQNKKNNSYSNFIVIKRTT